MNMPDIVVTKGMKLFSFLFTNCLYEALSSNRYLPTHIHACETINDFRNIEHTFYFFDKIEYIDSNLYIFERRNILRDDEWVGVLVFNGLCLGRRSAIYWNHSKVKDALEKATGGKNDI